MPSTHHPIMFHTILLSLLHLLVDGISACGLMMITHKTTSYVEACGMIVLYDVLAFGTQPLTGRWLDTNGVHPRALVLAVILLASGALVSSLTTSLILLTAILGATLLGMGNSFFHVYGGKSVAVSSRYDIRAMGIFVSTGAVGLAIGLGFYSLILLIAFFFTFLALCTLHLYYADSQKATAQAGSPILNNTKEEKSPALPTLSVPFLYLSSLMLIVAGRACIGEAVPSLRISIPSMSTPLMMVVISIIVMAGKAAGGFLSKWWGVRNVFTISMLLSATFFLMCPWHDCFVLITLLLINLSMPCTLYLATKAVPGREGWVFGLLAMAILPGFLLGYLSKDNAAYQAFLMPLMATILLESLLLLYMRERRWQVLSASVVLNIFTNVPLNAFIMAYNITSPFYIFGLECVVVVIEFIGSWFVLHDQRKAFKYSFLCNSFSALVGFFFQLILAL